MATSLLLIPVASMGWIYTAAALLSGAVFLVEAHRLLTRARGAYQREQYQEALAYFRKACQLDTHSPEALLGLGEVARAHGIELPSVPRSIDNPLETNDVNEVASILPRRPHPVCHDLRASWRFRDVRDATLLSAAAGRYDLLQVRSICN